jgi:hypothetical protein
MENEDFWKQINFFLKKSTLPIYFLLACKSILKIGFIILIYLILDFFEEITRFRQEGLFILVAYVLIEVVHIIFRVKRYNHSLKHVEV